ncbi:MAG: ribulose-phosphate 3-epimerase [Aeriscardovia sp.]|nr:ribulose-phosphate 3-epimerase [Aeriscardovia sp.]
MDIKIAPSILSADFCNLQSELEAVRSADLVHVDVMDAHFVPNLTIGAPVVERIAQVSPLPLDVHLMIDSPDLFALDYAFENVENIAFHLAACHAPIRLARKIREKGIKACCALNPAMGLEGVLGILSEFDSVLIMSVEPGFGGQKFLASQLLKLSRLKKEAEDRGLDIKIEIDGGINKQTIGPACRAGADILVAGSAIYGEKDRARAIKELREIAERA